MRPAPNSQCHKSIAYAAEGFVAVSANGLCAFFCFLSVYEASMLHGKNGYYVGAMIEPLLRPKSRWYMQGCKRGGERVAC